MKFAVIGLGRRTKHIVNLFRQADPEIKVTAIIDSNPDVARANLAEENREGVTFHDTVDDLVTKGKPDAIIIGTRCDSHTRYAIEVAKYDLPLFLEKPVSINMEQALALEQAFDGSRCKVMVSFPLRHSSLAVRAKELLSNNAVGRIDHILAQNYVKYGNVYFDTWHRDYSVTQGLFLQKATHDLDYMMYLVGAPVVRIAAMASCGRIYRDTKTKVGNPDPNAIYLPEIGTPEEGMNEDSSSALLEFANGTRGVYTQVFHSPGMARRGATISGYRGALSFDWYENKITVNNHLNPFVDEYTASNVENHFGGDQRLINSFIAMVREGAESPAPISTGLESVYACLAAKESIETGRFIQVRQLGSC